MQESGGRGPERDDRDSGPYPSGAAAKHPAAGGTALSDSAPAVTGGAEDRREKQAGRKPLVTEEEVAAVVSDWTKIPVQKLQESEGVRLQKLEQTLHKRVVGQEEAVTAVAKAVRRGRVGLKDPKRPIGSFLFLGPTGVGKTELSKALSEALFHDENAMIRVDMSGCI